MITLQMSTARHKETVTGNYATVVHNESISVHSNQQVGENILHLFGVLFNPMTTNTESHKVNFLVFGSHWYGIAWSVL